VQFVDNRIGEELQARWTGLIGDAHRRERWYAERGAVTAAVGFIDGSTPTSTLECVLRAEVTPGPYEPGAFDKWEPPFLREAVTLVERRHAIEAVVIDGDLWLRDGQPGLGARLAEALGARIAVIGVAKAAFAGGSGARDPRRQRRPLFVTAAGMCRGAHCLTCAPVLRISPHVDSATEDLEAFASELAEATELPSQLPRNSDDQPLRRDRLALPDRPELCCLTTGFARAVFPTSRRALSFVPGIRIAL
jgi:deoxyribonuclease V